MAGWQENLEIKPIEICNVKMSEKFLIHLSLPNQGWVVPHLDVY